MDKDTVIFLDVDGVLNHLYLWGRKNTPGFTKHEFEHVDEDGVSKYRVAVYFPDWMPELVQYLVDNYEVHWLTTWRHEANHQLAPILGIPELPVITDGTRIRMTGWKANAARPLAESLLAQGKRVIWIEDFYGRFPFMPEGVEFVDTGGREGLFGTDIAGLIPMDLLHRTRPGLDADNECGECWGTLGRHKLSCSHQRGGFLPSCNECLAPLDFHETWCIHFWDALDEKESQARP